MTMTVGDRVELVRTDDEWTTLRPGALGTVESIVKVALLPSPFTQIWVNWDDGSRLAMIPEDGDEIRKVVTDD